MIFPKLVKIELDFGYEWSHMTHLMFLKDFAVAGISGLENCTRKIFCRMNDDDRKETSDEARQEPSILGSH